MSVTRLSTVVMCAAAFALAGCAQQRRDAAVRPLCAPGAEKLRLMNAAVDVLGQMHFAIEKADPNIGLIRTRPLTGAQFFEFWRSDNSGPFSAAEASIQTIRRVAQLNLNEQNAQVCLTCTVRTYRLNMPEHEISSSARAYTMFSKSSSKLQRIKLYPQQAELMVWTDLGDDGQLAAEILRRIERRITSLQKEETI
jgi:hypothetical protein